MQTAITKMVFDVNELSGTFSITLFVMSSCIVERQNEKQSMHLYLSFYPTPDRAPMYPKAMTDCSMVLALVLKERLAQCFRLLFLL
mmetsp:Transcript_3821/g.10031  ORF Transcript_3821/g.10031 Transcript_3821/m.10031 type:complete len:86 (+) Transcript_3821:326-583(+)